MGTRDALGRERMDRLPKSDFRQREATGAAVESPKTARTDLAIPQKHDFGQSSD